MAILFEIVRIAWAEAARMWWFTLLGVVVAALIKTYQLDRRVSALVVRAGPWSVLVATAIGMLSPLCACGILPIVIPMALSGVPLPPLLALLATSPTMDPTSFVLTWGGLGPQFAWWKLGGSAFLGLACGLGASVLGRAGFFGPAEVRLAPVYGQDGQLAPAREIACANGFRVRSMVVVARESRFRFFLDRFRDVGLFVGTWVGLAILLDACVQALVPSSAFVWLAGRRGVGAILVAAAAGIPLPLNQVAAVPIVAALRAKGLPAGADLALLLAGPVTSLPAIVALSSIFRPRVVAFFVAAGFGGSIFLGLLLRWTAG